MVGWEFSPFDMQERIKSTARSINGCLFHRSIVGGSLP